MATTQATGIAHLTVVPENFDPDGDEAGDEAGSDVDPGCGRDE